MGLIESLKDGRFGVELRMPLQADATRDEELLAELVDESTGVHWLFLFFPNLHLDLCDEHRAHLGRSLEWYARSIFDGAFQEFDHPNRISEPRTADPSWSPMVDVEHLTIGGTRALRTVHRVAYERGREIVMGHLLVPLRRGLFEARVVCVAHRTGYRESFLTVKRPPEDEDFEQWVADLSHAVFDDPAHDDAFPEHPLSRTRAAIHWLRTDSALRVTELPSPIEHGRVRLSRFDCTIIPPPRFVYRPPTEQAESEGFCRISFCGTDGVEYLLVHRWDDAAVKSQFDLTQVSELYTHRLHEEVSVKDMQVAVSALPPFDGRPRTLAIVEGTGHMGELRSVMSYFLDEHGRVWSLCRPMTEGIPLDPIVTELDSAVRSFQLSRK